VALPDRRADDRRVQHENPGYAIRASKSQAMKNRNPATATDRVYQGIYMAMLEHRLEPGAWLREEELAQTFGVSRTVVRQALQRLAQDRLIELLHNRGARVTQPALQDAEHVFEARRVIECEIARRLGGRLSDRQLDELDSLARAEGEADVRGDAAAAVRLSGEFHQALARMHGNPLFTRQLDSLLPSTSILMATYKVVGGPVCVAHRHADVVQALRQGGPAAASEMRRHLRELQQSLIGARASSRPLRDVFAPYREASESQATDPT
jgi:DNA-binding GntR family transcriptional regulator